MPPTLAASPTHTDVQLSDLKGVSASRASPTHSDGASATHGPAPHAAFASPPSSPAAAVTSTTPAASVASFAASMPKAAVDHSLVRLYAVSPRRNGLQRPWHPSQVLVWGSLLVVFASYFGLLLPFIPSPEHATLKWASLGIYLAFLAVGIPCYVKVQAIDPALRREESKPVPESVPPGGDPNARPVARLCDRCHLWLQPRTKHCNLCRKCIAGFDHHCLYLNTCIGEKNYGVFFATISLTSLLLAAQLALTLYLLIQVGREQNEFIRTVEDSGLRYRAAYLALLCCFSALPTIFLLLVASLCAFHVQLLVRGQTTYEWIMARRARDTKRDEVRAAAEESARRDARERIRSEREAEWRREREKDREKRARATSRSASTSGSAAPSGASTPRAAHTLSSSGLRRLSSLHNAADGGSMILVNSAAANGGDMATLEEVRLSISTEVEMQTQTQRGSLTSIPEDAAPSEQPLASATQQQQPSASPTAVIFHMPQSPESINGAFAPLSPDQSAVPLVDLQSADAEAASQPSSSSSLPTSSLPADEALASLSLNPLLNQLLGEDTQQQQLDHAEQVEHQHEQSAGEHRLPLPPSSMP